MIDDWPGAARWWPEGCHQDGPADEGERRDRVDGQRFGDEGRRDRLPEAEQAHGEADDEGAEGCAGVTGGERPWPYQQDGGKSEPGYRIEKEQRPVRGIWRYPSCHRWRWTYPIQTRSATQPRRSSSVATCRRLGVPAPAVRQKALTSPAAGSASRREGRWKIIPAEADWLADPSDQQILAAGPLAGYRRPVLAPRAGGL